MLDGGVSKFQYISFAIIVCGMLSGGFFLYSIPYFEKQPPLLCKYTVNQVDWQSCTKEEACAPGVYAFEPDPNSIDTLNNWVEQMNLYCTPSIDIGFLGSAFITGCFFGSFIFPRCADIYGRRPIFMIGLCIQICVVLSSLFCTSLDLAYFLLFMGGVGETCRYYVAYVYAVEMMP